MTSGEVIPFRGVAAVATRRPTSHPEVIDGPFSTRALLRLDEALRLADQGTGLRFSVYVGPLAEPVRDSARALHARLPEPDRSVLLAVSPDERVVEVITGEVARRRVLDRDCALAAMSMVAAFTGGDLGGGIVAGLAQLADHATRRTIPHASSVPRHRRR